jgi:hypothetical protein
MTPSEATPINQGEKMQQYNEIFFPKARFIGLFFNSCGIYATTNHLFTPKYILVVCVSPSLNVTLITAIYTPTPTSLPLRLRPLQ